MSFAAKIAFPLIVLVVVSTSGCRKSGPTAGEVVGAEPFAAVRMRIEQLVAEGTVPSMAVAVARDGEIVWEQGFGLADRENNIPATEHTAYPLASVSKPLTATALMILAERGLIDLDAPVNDYLGEVKLTARVGEAEEATVRRVACHTAGLPLHDRHFYDGEAQRPPSFEQTLRRYGQLVSVPGERWQYSNLGYGILGEVISRVSGRDYAEFMQAEVFTPLGMQHTSVHVGPGLAEGQAVKYTSDGLVVPPCDTDTPGASAIYGSAHDLIRFALFHLKNHLPDQSAVLSGNSIDEMQRPSPETGPLREWEGKGSGYGIGWFVGVSEEGLRVVQHNGGTLGVSTVLALLPEENLAVAVLSNTHGSWPDIITIEIVSAILSLRPEDFLPSAGASSGGGGAGQPFAPPPELVGSWDGWIHTYEGEVPLTLEIQQSGTVYATLGEQPPTPVQAVSCRDTLPQFLNAGGGRFLRGWMPGKLQSEDIERGLPTKLWFELSRE
jgi:CubicO group peptidase (beta-lactamase class C family)